MYCFILSIFLFLDCWETKLRHHGKRKDDLAPDEDGRTRGHRQAGRHQSAGQLTDKAVKEDDKVNGNKSIFR